MFLSAVWTLILTAPIHCRASIAETLMQRHISTNLMKKQLIPDLGWPTSISANVLLKGSYDAILKIIILCIWCNRIC